MGSDRRTIAARVRAGAVLLIGMVGLHWLCYLPGAGSGTGPGVAIHAEIASVTPWLLLLAGLAVLGSLALSHGSPRHVSRSTAPFELRAARYAIALLICFSAQELIELLWALDAGHALDALAGPAAWLLLPACFFIGAVAALAARTLDRVAQRLVAAAEVVASPECSFRTVVSALTHVTRTERPLAFGLARRPPPLPLSA